MKAKPRSKKKPKYVYEKALKAFGKNFKRLKDESGLTYEAISEMSGVSIPALIGAQQERNLLNLVNAANLAAVFDVKVEELLS